MYERAADHPKIEIKTHRQVKSWVAGENGLEGAILEDPRDGKIEEITCTGAFIAIGHKPITAFLEGQLETDDSEYPFDTGHSVFLRKNVTRIIGF